MAQSSERPRLADRILVATLFAVIGGLIAWRVQYLAHGLGGDYLVLWRAAHVVFDGGDPHLLSDPGFPFYYPLPAVAMGFPFVRLRPENAAIAFTASSSAFLGFVLTRNGFERVPVVLSVPFFAVAQFGQTSTLIWALGMIPLAAGFTVMKPNVALALFAWNPRWRTVAVGAALLLGTFLVSPEWPSSWLSVLRKTTMHHAPIMVGFGAATIVAFLRWRRPEARLLGVMALVPHGLYFYDELPLWLVATTRRESMLITVTSWFGLVGWFATSGGLNENAHIRDMGPWVIASIYLPCLFLVLRRPNVGTVPAIVESAAARLPAWIRGQPPNDREGSTTI